MSIYSKSNPPSGFYVYAYLRQDGTPYYIGKGKGTRAWSVQHSVNLPNNKDNIVILKESLDEENAFLMETNYILLYGRKDISTGILRNKTNGGDGAAGATRSAKTRAKMGLSKIGNKHSLGVKRTPEQCEAIGKRSRGKKHSLEQNANHSKIMSGRKHSEEHKLAKSKAFSAMIWITDSYTAKRINKHSPIPEGWTRGRIKSRPLL